MRKILTLITVVLCSILSFGQEQVMVVYESGTKLDFKDEEEPKTAKEAEISEAIKKAMEEKHYFELTTSLTESTIKIIEKIDNEQKEDDGMRIKIISSYRNMYKNIADQYSLRSMPAFGKDIIIKDSLVDYNWQITREKESFMGYEVRKATSIKEDITIEAWYAPAIPIKNGPAEFWGLPGLILKIKQISDSPEEFHESYFIATQISQPEEIIPLEKPTKGELMSQQEYMDFQDEQLKKIQAMKNNGVDTSD